MPAGHRADDGVNIDGVNDDGVNDDDGVNIDGIDDDGIDDDGIDDAPVPLRIDGTLDLHAFAPSDVKALVTDYLHECRRLGVYQVRIIHGKGRGVLLRTVQALLPRLPGVVSFRQAGEDGGGWGSTLVELAPLAPSEVDP